MATEFKIPELGENINEGDVVSVLVAVGDTVTEDQPVIELETGKATMEVPTSIGGVVKEIRVAEGDTAAVGQVVLVIDEADGDASGDAAEAPSESESEPQSDAGEETAPQPQPKPTPAPAEEKEPKPTPAPAEEKEPKPTPAPAEEKEKKADSAPAAQPPARPAPVASGTPVAAAPSVRKFARELGVDIVQVKGSGPGGRIRIDDVKLYTKHLVQSGGAPIAAGIGAVSLPDFSTWGEVEITKMSNIRKATAEHMARCWATVPHVTQNDKADITDLEALRKQWKHKAEAREAKLTPTAILLKIAAAALHAHPQFNASIDVGNNEIIRKKYIHIGVAVDTPKGLIVPVIRDADRKNILELAAELTELAGRAREGKIGLDEMQGGCFTITNLGGIGGSHFTPIVNHPEVAILGVGRAEQEQVYREGNFVPRLRMPLSLSYDHRIIDGADGARFLRWICEAIEEPLLMAMEG